MACKLDIRHLSLRRRHSANAYKVKAGIGVIARVAVDMKYHIHIHTHIHRFFMDTHGSLSTDAYPV